MLKGPVRRRLATLANNPRQLIALVITALVALFAATTLLAAAYHEMREERAREHFEEGQALAGRGELTAAVQEYRAALSLIRGYPEAERALALALLSLDRHAEAESYFRDLLQRDPADGPINRGIARIAVARGRPPDARASYQRAIYGQWPGDQLTGRIETRFELIEYLRSIGAREEVLAELLRLKTEIPPEQTAVERRLSEMLVTAGAVTDAIDVLRRAAVSAPKDVELLAHLARTELDAGRSVEARATLRRALQLEPKREDLRTQMTVIDRVLALDPTLPRLRLVERTRRARRVLAAVVDQTAECADDADEQSALASLRAEAQRRLRRRAVADAEVAEEDLRVASRLWAAAPGCHDETSNARAIAQVLQRVESSAEEPQA